MSGTVPARPSRDRPLGETPGTNGTRDGVPRDVLDLRLVPAALACWTGAALATAGPADLARPAATSALGTVLLLGVVPVRGRRYRGRPQVRAAAALALAVLALALLGGAVQRELRSAGLLGTALHEGATVTVTGTVTDAPRAVDARWTHDDPEQRYSLAVHWVESHGRRSGAAASVVVIGPGEVPRGATVQVTGRFASSSGEGPGRAVGTLAAGAPARLVRGPGWGDRAAESVRAATRLVAARLPADPGSLLLGMALGDSSQVPDDLSEAMRGAGLTHLVAVSGSHFALVGALVAGAAAACRLPRAARAAAVIVVGAALLLVVGPQPSVVRAAVTGTVGLLGLLAGRPARAPAALALTVIALLLVDPWLSLEIGFVLSVVATAAIVLLGGAWVRRWSPRCGRPLATVVAVPLAAQLACAPVLLVLRPSVGTYALLANIAVAPAVPPATILGVLTAVVAPWCPSAALVLAHLAGAACWWVATVARVASAAPGAQLAWAPGAGGIVALVAVSVAVASLLLVRRDRRRAPARRGGG